MPHLSHSSCEAWAQCRRRWYLQKIEGAPQAPSEALILGTAVHAVIEDDGRELMNGHDSNDLRLHVWLDGALEDALAKDDPHGLISAEQRRDMRAKGHAIIDAYIQHLRPRYRPSDVEDNFTVDIPGAPGWRFTGRIDARVTLADGTPAIADFKTGKAWEPGAEHGKEQATAYLWADHIQRGYAQAVVFCIFPVKPDGNGGYTCTPQFRATRRTGMNLQVYKEGLQATARSIEQAKRTNEFPAKTGPLCGWCGVLGSCSEGQQWLASKGRTPAIPVVRRTVEVEVER